MAVNEKDKYYTPEWLVKHTIQKAIEIIGKDNITEVVEPSAGDGAFIEQLRLSFNGITYRFYDLYPEHPEVIKQDYKQVRLSYKKGRLTIGNPPFGTSSCLWKAFCKKAATNSDYIAFISPASQYNSNYYFKEGVLVYSELLNDVEYRGSEKENGKNTKVNTCLNIYKCEDRDEAVDIRDEMLDRDVFIKIIGKEENCNADFYMGNWGGGLIGKIVKEPKWISQFSIKILNESKRKEIEEFFYTYRGKYFIRGITFNLYSGAERLNINILKEQFKKHMYPTREERLEQDVNMKDYDYRYHCIPEKYDCFLTYFGGFYYDKKTDNGRAESKYGIFIIIENEEQKDKIKDYLKKISSSEFKDKGCGLTSFMVKEYLIKHLYPTREERLEQDVNIHIHHPLRDGVDNSYDFYMSIMNNCDYKMYDECPNITVVLVCKIKNIELKNKVKSYLQSLEKSKKSLSIPLIKEELIKHLYPEDSYDDYPEVRKSVHIERAIYAKPLLEVPYEPEPIKEPKQISLIKAKELF